MHMQTPKISDLAGMPVALDLRRRLGNDSSTHWIDGRRGASMDGASRRPKWPADGCDPTLPGAGDALLVVDLQRDFLPGGSLPVSGADRVVRRINRCLDLFAECELPVFFSRNWHPATYCSFQEQGGEFPRHCVEGSAGAAFADDLRLPMQLRIVSKSTRPEHDSCSAFDGTDLAGRLRAGGVNRLFVGGLATDHCVLQTVKDARELGFDVVVLRDAVAAIDARPGDGRRALARMQELGASLVDSEEIVGHVALRPAGRPAPGS